MGTNPKAMFRRSLLASSISSCLLASAYVQAQDSDMLEEVVVTGVYASQLNAVNTKRDAASVVDAISAEDIGKLPDVTISDSLQRIPGIQVERTAGEGGPVQIRGLGNVDTTLNGESFLSATTIDSSGADFGDLPSQLFSGADVYKSPLATLTSLGISGTINLKTRRPFDLDEGWTFAGSAEIDQGSISDEADPTISALVGWNNDRFGFLVSAVTTEKNLATDYNGYFDTSENGGIGAANNNHTWSAPAYD
ncbi:MAG TPA: TonB-dependent receptor plug domain-containing protein [Cellvibrionaceae bacterium]